jgi:fatty acid CoA ligase FadD9
VFDTDGYYHTGDIVAELGPDQIKYLDRRNDVLKLAQGEFVTASHLEAVFGASPLVHQIYVYGNSSQPSLLAVVVPSSRAVESRGLAEQKVLIATALQEIGAASGLQPYEIPRDLIIETRPFTTDDGLLTGIGKLVRPRLRERYGERLEKLYAEVARQRNDELENLRTTGGELPVVEGVLRAATALLQPVGGRLVPEDRLTQCGGDSMAAVDLSTLLEDMFDVEVPVGLVVSPTSDLQAIANHIEAERHAETSGPGFSSVHGSDPTVVQATDLRLDAFFENTPRIATPPAATVNTGTVLLTGATGFLGRYLLLDLLSRIQTEGGRLICLVSGKDDLGARRRLDAVFDRGDPPSAGALPADGRRATAGHRR